MFRGFCTYPWEEVFVDTKGDVKFCCFMKDKLGNLSDSTFMDVWNNNKAISVRNSIKNGYLHVLCNTVSCPHYHSKCLLKSADNFYDYYLHKANSDIFTDDNEISVDFLDKAIRYPNNSNSCEHEFVLVQNFNVGNLQFLQELFYYQRVYACVKCGYKKVEFSFNWEADPIGGSFTAYTEYGDGEADFYFPIVTGGLGDFFGQLRQISVLNNVFGKTFGVILTQPYKVFSSILKYFNIKAFVLDNGDLFSSSFYVNLRKFIYSKGLDHKMRSYSYSMSLCEYQGYGNIMDIPVNNLPVFDILIHRRNIEHTRYSTRNFSHSKFLEIISSLGSVYKVGIVGNSLEDPYEYVNDLRKFSFHDQVLMVNNAKLVIDTDSIFDKVGEACGTSSFIVQLYHYLAWGMHLKFNNDYIICTPTIDELSSDDIIKNVFYHMRNIVDAT